MKYLFIDANIYLDFYHFSKDDLVELEKLVELVNNKKVHLLSTPQLKDEVSRNRDGKLADGLRNFESLKFKCEAPIYVRQHPDFKQLQSSLSDANKFHSQLTQQIRKDITERKLQTDILVAKLLELSEELDGQDKAFNKALDRFRKGNPPGKKKVTVGDELNWEHLLLVLENGVNLHFVSGDSDFASDLDSESFSTFLSNEWNRKKNSKISYYNSIGAFCRKHFPDIKLVMDVEISVAIEKLAASGSFHSTHLAIAALERFSDFSVHQATELVDIALQNNQINWIASDDDIFNFYSKLLESQKKNIDKQKVAALTSLLQPQKQIIEENDVPF